MDQVRPIASFLLLTVYLIVLGHGIVAHHHHDKAMEKSCHTEQELSQHPGYTEICAVDACHHEEQARAACHFQVEPVPGKGVSWVSAVLTACVLFEICFSDEEPVCWNELLLIFPKSPDKYSFGLRAPPVFA